MKSLNMTKCISLIVVSCCMILFVSGFPIDEEFLELVESKSVHVANSLRLISGGGFNYETALTSESI